MTGGRQAAFTNKTKYGLDYYHRIGHIGGSRRGSKGFALNRGLASLADALGGSISRRGHKLNDAERERIRRDFDRKYKKAYQELLAVHTKAQRQREAAVRLDVGAIAVFDRKRGLVRKQVA